MLKKRQNHKKYVKKAESIYWTYANANTIKKAARFKIIKSRTEPLYFLCDFYFRNNYISRIRKVMFENCFLY